MNPILRENATIKNGVSLNIVYENRNLIKNRKNASGSFTTEVLCVNSLTIKKYYSHK